MKCGIKCEIHDCTLALFRFLFGKEFRNDILEEVEDAKEQRINAQYYTNRVISDKKYNENLKDTPNFVLKLESFTNSFTKDQVDGTREKLKRLMEK